MDNKGQLTLSDAPGVVLTVGIVFLLMATIALVGSEFGESFPADQTYTGTDESVPRGDIIAPHGHVVDGARQQNAQSFTLSAVTNGTGGAVIGIGNFKFTSDGALKNTSSLAEYGATNFIVNYTNLYSGVASNITTDLNTEIGNNTSIAGIILTISLVGIVLTVLIGIFVGFRNRNI